MKFWNRAKPALAGILALALAACTPPKPNDPATADWLTNPQDATTAALQKGRPIFIAFLATDWSTASKGAVKDVLDTRAFKEFADSNLILLKVDFSRTGMTPDMQKSYDDLAKNLGVDHFPMFVMADPYHGVGKFSQINNYGLGGPVEFVGQVSGILDTWRNIVATQLSQIQAKARAQAQAAAAESTPSPSGMTAMPSPEQLFHQSQPPTGLPTSTAPAPTLPTQPSTASPAQPASPAATGLPLLKLN